MALASLRTEVKRHLSLGEHLPRTEVIQHRGYRAVSRENLGSPTTALGGLAGQPWLVPRLIYISPGFLSGPNC